MKKPVNNRNGVPSIKITDLEPELLLLADRIEAGRISREAAAKSIRTLCAKLARRKCTDTPRKVTARANTKERQDAMRRDFEANPEMNLWEIGKKHGTQNGRAHEAVHGKK